MNKKQIQTIKKILDEQIIDTQNKINEYTKLCQPIPPENAIGRVSRMDAINNKSVTELVLRKAEEKLKNLQIVEREMTKSNFGICIKCKNEIPVGRLMIVPESRKCVNCA